MPAKTKTKNYAPIVLTFSFILISATVGAIYFWTEKNNLRTSTTSTPQDAGFAKVSEQATPAPSPTPEILVHQPPTRYELAAAQWIPQSFNNCGPAATAMLLQYFGYNLTQEQTEAELRTHETDTNVFTSEISDYIDREFGLKSKIMFDGDIELLKTLVANDIYVLIEAWLHPYEDIGHFLIIRGYDDERQVLIGDDSYISVGHRYPYETFDQGQWKAFNRQFMPVYRPDQEELVKEIVGELWYEHSMYESAIVTNTIATEEDSQDMYAWFNLGTSYYQLGEYEQAKEAFERSRQIGWPGRMLWYQIQPVQTYNQLGEYQKALELAQIGLRANTGFTELQYEAAVAHHGLDQKQQALAALQEGLAHDPTHQPSLELQSQLQ